LDPQFDQFSAGGFGVRATRLGIAPLRVFEVGRCGGEVCIKQLRKYGNDLIAYARARGQGIPLPEPPDTRALIAAPAALARHELRSVSARAEQVRAYANFLSTHSHVLSAVPGEAIVVARNSACGGAAVEQAETLADALTRPWLARDPRPPTPVVRPQCRRMDWVELRIRGGRMVSVLGIGARRANVAR
jgi:hypothetical protein